MGTIVISKDINRDGFEDRITFQYDLAQNGDLSQITATKIEFGSADGYVENPKKIEFTAVCPHFPIELGSTNPAIGKKLVKEAEISCSDSTGGEKKGVFEDFIVQPRVFSDFPIIGSATCWIPYPHMNPTDYVPVTMGQKTYYIGVEIFTQLKAGDERVTRPLNSCVPDQS